MQWSVGRKITVSFVTIFMVLVVRGFFSYKEVFHTIESGRWVEHTHEVIGQIAETLLNLTTSEGSHRDYLITSDEKYIAPYKKELDKANESIELLRKLTNDNPRQQQRIDRFSVLVKERNTIFDEAIELRKREGLEKTAQFVLTEKGKSIQDEIIGLADQMEAEERSLLKNREIENVAVIDRTEKVFWYSLTGSLVLLVIIGVWIVRDIVKPLNEVVTVAEAIAGGDLSRQVEVIDRADEVGNLIRMFRKMSESLRNVAAIASKMAARDLSVNVIPQSERDILGQSFATLVENLRVITGEIKEGVNVLASSAGEILASSTQIAASAAETASAISQTNSTLEEVKQTTQASSKKAQYVSTLSQKAADVSVVGKTSVDDSIGEMQRIQQHVQSIAENIISLSERSQSIGEIIATVNDLAEQSNLLAVNASIEAAKAGEHGRGFGVVAQEVRNLADQSRQATGQVRTLLGEIQKVTNSAVMATERATKAVDTGVKQSLSAGQSISDLSTRINEASQASTQISATSEQQLAGITQVVAAIQSINDASIQNAASTRQAERAARDLHELGSRLKHIVEEFRL